mmetsp:Transcript_40664/g.65981  ORF Transcript_40664/g.65981 Transcript_40664/m.65981 type:complete len:336 (-) Transcript_40664:596-1603(-)
MTLPFGTDPVLRDAYLSYYGDLRFGLIMEDLDVFAYRVALKHAEDGYKMTIVTASVDRIALIQRLDPLQDLLFRGVVSWVGRSSMEVSITCLQIREDDSSPTNILHARVLMVARDKLTQKATQVNRLEPITDEEKKRFSDGEERQQFRKQASDQSLQRFPPTAEELALLHQMFTHRRQTVDLPNDKRDWVLMEETRMQSTTLMHPQKRNIHGKIFGGYLMRLAFELAWCSACIHMKSDHPLIAAVDDVHFENPVLVGSVVCFSSQIVYVAADQRTLQVRVKAEYIDVKHPARQRFLTNVFSFTFASPDSKIVQVMPETYDDGIEYLEGRRRHNRD